MSGQQQTPSEELHHEHDAILEFLQAIEGLAAYIESEGEVPRADLEKALVVIVEFADRCHHGKEEVVLFPALREASPDRGAELARRLTSDHKAMRKLVASIRDLFARAPEPAARQQLAKNLITYPRLLREHIRIENEELLPEIDASFTPQEAERLAEAFARVEEDEIGPGKHEEYEGLIRGLVERYAG